MFHFVFQLRVNRIHVSPTNFLHSISYVSHFSFILSLILNGHLSQLQPVYLTFHPFLNFIMISTEVYLFVCYSMIYSVLIIYKEMSFFSRTYYKEFTCNIFLFLVSDMKALFKYFVIDLKVLSLSFNISSLLFLLLCESKLH